MRALSVAAFVALVVSSSACAQTPQAIRPTETPLPTTLETQTLGPETPSPIISSSPEPTVAPTPAPTPPPRPTTRKAGEQMYTFYFEARRQFPIFPPTPQIDFDEPAGSNGDSWFRGLNAS